MQSEKWLTRVLYVCTSVMWVFSSGLAIHSAATGSDVTRTVMFFVLGLTMCLTTAVLFSIFVSPLERVYRHGYQAGQCAALRRFEQEADLRVVGERRRSGVVPIRPINQGQSMRSAASNLFDTWSN
jgi:hypothetical protein